jgi:membrane-associated phospholipid phosphatase
MTAGGIRARFWIEASLESVRRDHTPELSPGDQRGPFLTARALGLALGALHDVKAIASGAQSLLGVAAPAELTGLVGPDQVDVAAAAASHQVLRLRYPNQASLLEPAWLNWLEYFSLGGAGSPAEIAGRAFGTTVHRLGQNDVVNGRAGQYAPNGAPYNHKAPATHPTQGFAGGAWGNSVPLATTRVTGFPPPPGRVDAVTVTPTQHYQDDFAKVAAKGDINRTPGDPSARTLDEEVIGIAWGYDGPPELGTPPRLYLQVVLTILDSIEERNPGQLLELDELAIVAGVAVALADAGIDAWHYKYAPTHLLWRPAVGIREAVVGNGTADPNWWPLGRPDTNGTGTGLTPDFPAYPSGHATFGAAAFQLLRLFLAEKGVATFTPEGVDDVRFEFVSDEFNGRNKDPRTRRPRDLVTLSYASLWDAIVDNSVSRVYLGVHWQFDGITTRDGADDKYGIPATPSVLGHTGGVWLGAQIANQIAPKLNISQATIAASGIS